ncbi:membrane-spanning 4-domains subfamily A member 4A-like isoform X2 [Notechis scutatus]|uniref:Membrane-spanning 4-domains subfamily A member 4A-like isoform X2 n=1 Tax=Notechis scutatus TaxID=8663 RepID=A0A6J1VXF9_9SAUR|nr:membrane-spanning 4-domains subfamily A member 4A-like isoform X2 [Notechis scutatus]
MDAPPVVMTAGSLSYITQTDLPVPLKKFYRGEPLALGYIISGSLAVAAAWNPRMPLVQSMVAMNVLSTVAAGLGLASLFATFGMPYLFNFSTHCYNFEKEIQKKCNANQNIVLGILTILTLFTALEFCITISVASFGCKMLCRDTFSEKVVVIYQNVSPARAEQDPPLDCKQAAIQP